MNFSDCTTSLVCPVLHIIENNPFPNDFGFCKPENSDWSSDHYISFDKHSIRTHKERSSDGRGVEEPEGMQKAILSSMGGGWVGSAFIISNGEHTRSTTLWPANPCWLNE